MPLQSPLESKFELFAHRPRNDACFIANLVGRLSIIYYFIYFYTVFIVLALCSNVDWVEIEFLSCPKVFRKFHESFTKGSFMKFHEMRTTVVLLESCPIF